MNKKLQNLIINIILISLLAPILILFVWVISSSWVFPKIIPNEFSLRGFEYILSGENARILINSILISIVVVILTMIICIPASKAIALYDFKGKRLFELLVLSPIIIPVISIAMGLQLTFIKIGLANTILGVIIINIIPCIPYGVKMITDVYKLIGDKYEFEVKITLNRTGAYNFHSSYLIDIIGEGCNTYNFATNIAGANADSRIEFEVLE